MIHIGFTGTRRGMTEAQRVRVYELLWYKTYYAHHGDCVGADAEFDAIVKGCAGLRGIFYHPSNALTRAHCVPRYPHDVVYAAKPPLERDRDIVAQSDVMIATPKETSMVLRSGTWTTVRYALAARKPICIVMPNGGLVYDGGPWPL